MIQYICGKCLFAEECSSSDLIFCLIKEELRKVNDYPCARFKSMKKGIEEDD